MSMQTVILETSWQEALKEEMEKPYFAQLLAFVEQERAHHAVYPPEKLVFNALEMTPFDKVKVVIVGQDPYHGPGQAHGLSFSVPKGTPFPPSLQNIFKELQSDLNIPTPPHGCLESWAKQGVLLLNATLTVRESNPASHHKRGWEQFTDAIVHLLSQKQEPIVFVLWGKFAETKCRFLLDGVPCGTKYFKHLVLTAPHPSPLSCYKGFFGSRPFSKINDFLISKNINPISWELT